MPHMMSGHSNTVYRWEYKVRLSNSDEVAVLLPFHCCCENYPLMLICLTFSNFLSFYLSPFWSLTDFSSCHVCCVCYCFTDEQIEPALRANTPTRHTGKGDRRRRGLHLFSNIHCRSTCTWWPSELLSAPSMSLASRISLASSVSTSVSVPFHSVAVA